MLQASKRKLPEPARARVGPSEIFLGQKPGEELLGQVLCVLRTVSLSPHKGVSAIPVRAAQLFQDLDSLREVRSSCRQHHAPVRGGERPSRAWLPPPDGRLRPLRRLLERHSRYARGKFRAFQKKPRRLRSGEGSERRSIAKALRGVRLSSPLRPRLSRPFPQRDLIADRIEEL